MGIRFIADTMLGKLSKWLRVMGYDTHYQPYYKEGAIDRLVEDGRILLSRRFRIAETYPNSILIHSDRVGDQIMELRAKAVIRSDRASWFSRCLVCNASLGPPTSDTSLQSVPDYILHQGTPDLRLCPVCRRIYWPGSHKDRMILQLEKWGLQRN